MKELKMQQYTSTSPNYQEFLKWSDLVSASYDYGFPKEILKRLISYTYWKSLPEKERHKVYL